VISSGFATTAARLQRGKRPASVTTDFIPPPPPPPSSMTGSTGSLPGYAPSGSSGSPSPPGTPGGSSSEALMRKRKAIAHEILDTEVTYYNQLSCVVSLFVLPLQKDFGLSKDDIFTLFSNIEVIKQLHQKLLENLRARVNSWTDASTIGDVFVNNTAWIKLYKYYVNNFDASARLL
jgi:hypothetical protein